MKKNRALPGILFIASMFAGANAHNDQLLDPDLAVIQTVTVADVISLMNEFDFKAMLYEAPTEDGATIEVSANGGTFYIDLKQCAGKEEAARCSQLEPYGYFDGAGVTLNIVNDFNLDASALSSAGLMADGGGVIIADIYLNQGVTRANALYLFARFLDDVDTVLTTIEPDVLAKADFAQETPRFVEAPAGKSVNTVGRARPVFVTPAVRSILDRR